MLRELICNLAFENYIIDKSFKFQSKVCPFFEGK